ncbi:response regulator [Pseudomonas donghuensis]|uniref:response regulator n=1 Tax=Pseudomonas donghuensis TaxID=1163398 RepID=UPI000C29D8A4|nr:response regulator [Pseudomonas donghuensis]MBF4211116.1 response regulator [Pseudomonas donghuensis]MCP6697418.1 response regulator [Pseudomonas donghuensis]PJY94015.1 response regulator [Pseudomonas donghuensis]UVL27569.1 response regulator [Pseudomonas donghuensis]WKY26375.1 response regulator [Pseudomonas donghuensis]
MSTILVVDDEYLIADILRYALEDRGFDVELASNGQKALDVLKGKRVELVITDYMMPVMDGGALAVSIRAEPLLQGLPIILMSGAQAHMGRDNPGLFAAVFDKPFDIVQLMAKVKELVDAPEAS